MTMTELNYNDDTQFIAHEQSRWEHIREHIEYHRADNGYDIPPLMCDPRNPKVKV